jgi:hypothetical protein
LPVSKYFIQLSIYLSSLTDNPTSVPYFDKLTFFIKLRYDDIKMSSVDIKYFNLICHYDWQQPFSFSKTFRCTPHFVKELCGTNEMCVMLTNILQWNFTWHAGGHHFLVFRHGILSTVLPLNDYYYALKLMIFLNTKRHNPVDCYNTREIF